MLKIITKAFQAFTIQYKQSFFKIKKICLNKFFDFHKHFFVKPKSLSAIFHDKILLISFVFIISIFASTMIYSQNQFFASLVQTNNTLEESEIPFLFTEYNSIREINIQQNSKNNYLVEFLANQNTGDSLHLFNFSVYKNNNTTINIEEIQDSFITEIQEELDFISEAIDIEIQK
jgi:hypothetical protein